jgi:hypothetical protein
MKGVFGLICLLWASVVSADLLSATPTTEVYAIAAGYPVTYSCVWAWFDSTCLHPEIDRDGAWCACTSDFEQWIRISSGRLENWIGVITQGRTRYGQRVEEYYITYTLDGITWERVEDGRVFKGNYDQHTKVRNDFAAPVRARAIRLHPIKWQNAISMRFEGIFSVKVN